VLVVLLLVVWIGISIPAAVLVGATVAAGVGTTNRSTRRRRRVATGDDVDPASSVDLPRSTTDAQAVGEALRASVAGLREREGTRWMRAVLDQIVSLAGVRRGSLHALEPDGSWATCEVVGGPHAPLLAGVLRRTLRSAQTAAHPFFVEVHAADLTDVAGVDRGELLGCAIPLHLDEGIHVVVLIGPRDALLACRSRLDAASEAFAEVLGTGQLIDRVVASDELQRHRFRHDPASGLPNQTALAEHLRALAANDHEAIALIVVQIDPLDLSAGTMGERSRVEVLRETGVHLRTAIRPGTVLGHTGPRQFAVLTPHGGHAERLATTLLATLDDPIRGSGWSVYLRASAGVAVPAAPDEPFDALYERALAAAGGAKGRTPAVSVSGRDAHAAAVERITVERAVRDELRLSAPARWRLAYQPIVDLDGGDVLGVESLLRWQSSALAPISPADVVAISAEAGLMPALGERILRAACVQGARWFRDGRSLRVAVNVDAAQLETDDLLFVVDRALSDSAMPPELLQLEMTESAAVTDFDRCAQVLGSLRHRGVSLALDDFGTGYSSLARLRQLPVDTVKVDRSFVEGLGDGDAATRAIVGTVVDLAHSLGMRVTAEGVETAGQLRALLELGCDEAQGFLLGRPESASAVLLDLDLDAPELIDLTSVDGGLPPRNSTR
jgi:EAL domain-containing protein (putative c-di-GMP-specific phosphodiesterase class I)/GGDEF domain-containing protein